MNNETRATPEGESLERDKTGQVVEQGETDESDAPTDTEENEGMNTILSVEPTLGVQADASEE
ncbi:MAG: hypothetical protein H0V88_01700 [Pyrinomonadaceae bacterium]|nr:hypothetical protein [Pyrinomonadaceae bacterium]